jgi:hypothetical protein
MPKAVMQAMVILPSTIPDATIVVLRNLRWKSWLCQAVVRFSQKWCDRPRLAGIWLTSAMLWVEAAKTR